MLYFQSQQYKLYTVTAVDSQVDAIAKLIWQLPENRVDFKHLTGLVRGIQYVPTSDLPAEYY